MTLNPNQFAQGNQKGSMDLRFNGNIMSCIVKSDEATALLPGQAVKMVDNASGVPTVTTCTADEDDVFGFVTYTQKDKSFAAGKMVEIAFGSGCVMYMEAASAIARNAQVMIVVTGQKVEDVTSTNRIVGRALDKAASAGDLIRVLIDLPGALAA